MDLGQGAQIRILIAMDLSNIFLLDNQKRMVGLGQGAQIGNFGRDGPDKYFSFGGFKKW